MSMDNINQCGVCAPVSGLHVKVGAAPYGVNIWCYGHGRWTGRSTVMHKATGITVSRGKRKDTDSPLLVLDPSEAQDLLDDLWKCGYRPRTDKYDPQSHIDDLRKQLEWFRSAYPQAKQC